MQQAIVISSHYGADSGYPNFTSWTPSAELLAAKLAQHGYTIERLLPGTGLVKRLRDVLRREDTHSSTILYFAGYALVTEKGDPALLVADDDVTALRVSQLVSRVSRSFGRVLLLLDTVLGSSGADVEAACAARQLDVRSNPELAMAELCASTWQADNVGVLMGVRAWGSKDRNVSAFASLVERGLRELASSETPTTATELYDWLQDTEEGEQLTLRFADASPPFVVLPRRQFPSNPAALLPSPMVRMGVVNVPPPAVPAAGPVPAAAPVAPTPSPDPEPAGSEAPEPITTQIEAVALEPAESALATASLPPAAAPSTALPAPSLSAPSPPAAPPAPPEVAGPESWRPPPRRRPAEDEAGLVARARAAIAAGDDDSGFALARRCLSLFPQSVAALQIAATLLARTERWEELAALYEQLIAGHLDPGPVAKLCVAASRLYASKLNSPDRAVRALERACELQPKQSELHLEVAALYELQSREDAAESHYRSALNHDPLNVRCHRRACAFFAWTRQLDAAWNSASIVAFFTPPDANERELLERFTREGLPTPARSLTSGDFSSGLSASPSDPSLAQLFTFIAETARQVKLPKLRQQQQLLLECTAENAMTSTATLARAFVWSCRMLGIGVPELYLADDAGLPALLPVRQAAWRVGRGVGRGLSAAELVFLWTRALSRLRPEALASLDPADETRGSAAASGELLELVYAALYAVGRLHEGPKSAIRLGKKLHKGLDPSALQLLGEKLEGIDAANAPGRVRAWQRQLELVANRIGLIACADPRVAASSIDRFPAGETPRDEQLADLFQFAISPSYSALRRELGLALD